eukprot:CAMPEP_0168723710 /NCGR_PEP_ID=MMETSP0724-20121128/3257_1 /TAXON_ID=265536 /ORGANISM="Amphiprora sp., Strain CCMP467" /LENGTH=333 /DNA_ID=CAMNT_0008770429 /DNA_START=30 /DNA_END=1031 /DNA_ORIENTATION=-
MNPTTTNATTCINRLAPRARRALLYLQGFDSKKILKAATHPTLDCACLDMEDGVAVNRKQDARHGIVQALSTVDFGRTERVARINSFPPTTTTTTTEADDGTHDDDDPSWDWAFQDLEALLHGPVLPDAICIPKTESAHHVRRVSQRLDALGDAAAHVRLIGMIESPTALNALSDICTAAPHRLDMLIVGGDDYASAVGAVRTTEGHELNYLRNACLAQAAAHGVSCIDTVLIDFHNTEQLSKESRRSFELGFVGKQVIHPKQIDPVQEAYSPTPGSIDYASKVVQASRDHQHGAFAHEGKMIDRPTVKQLENLLQRATLMGLYHPRQDDNEE